MTNTLANQSALVSKFFTITLLAHQSITQMLANLNFLSGACLGIKITIGHAGCCSVLKPLEKVCSPSTTYRASLDVHLKLLLQRKAYLIYVQ